MLRIRPAAYIRGYAVELNRKARICDTLSWLATSERKRPVRKADAVK